MKKFLVGISYSLKESFPAARWCLAALVIAFSAVISIYRYIDLADISEQSFSSLETLIMIMTDSINIIFIYLPLYLFIICGLASDTSFGAVDIIKTGSRNKWLFIKLIALALNTVLFFILMTAMNLIISDRIFPFSDKWSSGFMSLHVMLGNSAADLKYPPLLTILLSLTGSFMVYLLCGIISLLVLIITDREEMALLFSLLGGIALSLLNYSISENDAFSLLLRCLIIFAVMVILYFICRKVISKKDFQMRKKTSLY